MNESNPTNDNPTNDGPSDEAMERVIAKYVAGRTVDDDGEEVYETSLSVMETIGEMVSAYDRGDIDETKAWWCALMHAIENTTARLVNGDNGKAAMQAMLLFVAASELVGVLRAGGEPLAAAMATLRSLHARALLAKETRDAIAKAKSATVLAPGSDTIN